MKPNMENKTTGKVIYFFCLWMFVALWSNPWYLILSDVYVLLKYMLRTAVYESTGD